jgi:hypothetical protein
MENQLDFLSSMPGLTKQGWHLPDTMTQPQWIDYGCQLTRIEEARQWWLGDWWNAGVQWGEGQAVCDALGLDYGTARNAGAVAAAVQLSRRRDNLSFSHHKEVCAIPDPAVQDRLLAWCLEPFETTGKPCSVRELREAVRSYLDAQGWTPWEGARRQAVEEGFTTLAHLKADVHLIRWAEFSHLLVRIDRTTKWGNPFEVDKDGDRVYVIESFAEHYLPRKPSLLAALPELNGKVLGCWCLPQLCHGEVLLEAADRLGYERLMETLIETGVRHADQ